MDAGSAVAPREASDDGGAWGGQESDGGLGEKQVSFPVEFLSGT